MLLSVILLAGSIASYAWFSISAGDTTVIIDSGGIAVNASLSYSDSISLSEINVSESFTEQQPAESRVLADQFYAGNTLSYKLVIENTDVVSAGIEVSFAIIKDYFDEAVNTYLSAVSDTSPDGAELNPTEEAAVKAVLARNSGSIMFRFSEIKYMTDGGELTPYTPNAYEDETAFKNGNTVSKDFSEGEPFFTCTLPAGSRITVYFMLEAMQSVDAMPKYRALRTSQADAVMDSDPARAAAIRAVLETELQCIIIERADDGTPGGGTEIKSADFIIKYIKVTANSN